MIVRWIPVALLLAAAPVPGDDPFLAAMAGKSGPDAVAAPSFDPDVEAVSWTTRPRREIVDALAARLLRGGAKGWFEPAKEGPAPPAPPSRFPEGFEAGEFKVADRLAARIPADAAAVFFDSLQEAETCVEELAKFLPRALPVPFGDAPGGRRDALALAVDRLLLPTIWRSNPNVRRGTRQAALLAADPDLRWAPEVALVVEVEDASLVRFHRMSTISWEDRGRRHLRVDGLDVVSDDGSVRSFFGLEGGIAVWSTGRAFRDRILAAAAGRAPTLLSPDPRAYALARATFPAADGGALLVIPDAFLERANSPAVRARRAAALRCDAVRMVAAARALGRAGEPPGCRLECPSGGTISVSSGSHPVSCSIHGSALHRVPSGDLPDAGGTTAPAEGDVVAGGAFPLAAHWGKGSREILVPPGRPGAAVLEVVVPPSGFSQSAGLDGSGADRLNRIHAGGIPESEVQSTYAAVFGEAVVSGCGRTLAWKEGRVEWEGASRYDYLERERTPFVPPPEGGVLRIGEPHPDLTTSGVINGGSLLPLSWR